MQFSLQCLARNSRLFRKGLPICWNNELHNRHLSTLALRRPTDKPEPWPYRERGYSLIRRKLDFTTKRLDENSKFIIVEGNVASGKGEVAKEIAKEFGFHHIACPTMDKMLINMYGSDMRDCYDLLPERFRYTDLERFYKDPHHVNVAQFFFHMLYLKLECYQNALTHLLNTGQGVVLENSMLADDGFMNAAYKKGYLSKDFRQFYRRSKDSVQPMLQLWPHLIVYIDTPIEKCMQNIEKRNIPYEVNSQVLDLEYLKTIEDWNKKKFLNHWDEFCALLVYDWTVPGDLDVIVEDIENMDLGDEFDWHRGDKFESWHYFEEAALNQHRYWATNKLFSRFCKADPWDVAELLYHPEDRTKAQHVLEEYHWGEYASSWNPEKDGWFNIMFTNPLKQSNPLRKDQWYEHCNADASSFQFGNVYNRD